MEKDAATRKGQTQWRPAEGCQTEVPESGGELVLSWFMLLGRGDSVATA